jgi:hypothetical protein
MTSATFEPQQDAASVPEQDYPSYAYKPSVMGAPVVFHLRDDVFEWSRGRQHGQIPYRDISALRLSFRPVTMQYARYQLQMRGAGMPSTTIASASWRSMVEMQSQLPEFRAFVLELHRRIAAAGGTPQCRAGIFPPLYWIGALTFAATSVGIAVLIVRALQAQQWAGAGFIAAFLALFLWQAGQFFRRNKPGVYPLTAPPDELLPKA